MKFLKDERIKVYENKYKAEGFNIMMALAFLYIMLDAMSVNLGFLKENMVLILFVIGAFYTGIRLTFKGLGSYSPIKGVHPLLYTTIICAIASIFYGVFLTIRNTNLYMDGKFSFPSVALFLVGAMGMFGITEVISVVIYLVSKKKEEKDIED